MMNDPISSLIIWASPFLGALVIWFISQHFNEQKNEFLKLNGKISKVENELIDTKLTVVKVLTQVENLDKIFTKEKEKQDHFENKVVTILREAKGRFK